MTEENYFLIETDNNNKYVTNCLPAKSILPLWNKMGGLSAHALWMPESDYRSLDEKVVVKVTKIKKDEPNTSGLPDGFDFAPDDAITNPVAWLYMSASGVLYILKKFVNLSDRASMSADILFLRTLEHPKVWSKPSNAKRSFSESNISRIRKLVATPAVDLSSDLPPGFSFISSDV